MPHYRRCPSWQRLRRANARGSRQRMAPFPRGTWDIYRREQNQWTSQALPHARSHIYACESSHECHVVLFAFGENGVHFQAFAFRTNQHQGRTRLQLFHFRGTPVFQSRGARQPSLASGISCQIGYAAMAAICNLWAQARCVAASLIALVTADSSSILAVFDHLVAPGGHGARRSGSRSPA